MDFLASLKWRYAAKKMNGKAVPQEKIDNILEAVHLAPTSLGLQPFKVLVISDRELLNKILPIANNQTQIVDCSHLLVFASWDNVVAKNIDDYVANVEQQRGLPENSMAEFRERIKGYVLNRTPEQNFEHSARQTYIALGFALAAAAVEQVDATPMEGFDNAALDELLQLKDQGLRSITILPIGYRDVENDWLSKLKKVRRDKKDFFIELN